jgi:hypothetical protein
VDCAGGLHDNARHQGAQVNRAGLSVAMGDYDRTRVLQDGSVRIVG